MAPKTLDEDFKFIMTCIKHSPPAAKPNFDEVAKELGAKSGNACYHRHWAIMKKWGMAGGGVGRARKAGGAGTTTTSTSRPRATKRKPEPSKSLVESTGTDGGSETSGSNEPATKKTKKAQVVKVEEDADNEDTEGELENAIVKTENGDDTEE